MENEIKIIYSHVKGEYHIQLFKEGILWEWIVVKDVNDIPNIINNFYHG